MLSAPPCCIRDAAACHLCLKCHQRCAGPRVGEKQPATKPRVWEAGWDRLRTRGTREPTSGDPWRQQARLRCSASLPSLSVCRRLWTGRLAVNGRCNGVTKRRLCAQHDTTCDISQPAHGQRTLRCVIPMFLRVSRRFQPISTPSAEEHRKCLSCTPTTDPMAPGAGQGTDMMHTANECVYKGLWGAW